MWIGSKMTWQPYAILLAGYIVGYLTRDAYELYQKRFN